MRILYVVQRYGEEIAGGAEQHAGRSRSGMVERGHHVTVLTTCASSYVDWANACTRAAGRAATACRCTGCRSRVARNPHLFGRFNRGMATAPECAPLSVQRDWMQMQGPYVPELVPWLRRHARAFDVVVFITYLYWTTWAGLRECAGAVPTVLHPTAHDEPPMRLSIFQEVIARARRVRVPHARGGRSRARAVPGRAARRGGRHRRRDGPARATATRSAAGSGSATTPYLLYVGRVDPGQGRGRAHRLLHRVQASGIPSDLQARAARRAARRRSPIAPTSS